MLICVNLTAQGSFWVRSRCPFTVGAPARLSIVPLPTIAFLQALSILIGLLACSHVQVGWLFG